MKKFAAVTVVALSTLLASGTVLAQAKPEVLVKQRQAAMTLQGKYFGPLGGMAQGKVPFNADVVKRNAAYLAVLDKMAWDGFTPATQDVKSRALPAIYSDAAKFKAAQASFQADVDKLVTVANGGDETATIAQLKAVAKNCGSCHNDFREKN